MGDLVGYQGLDMRIQAITRPTVGRAMSKRWGLRTVREAKRLVRRRTSNLSRSIHIGVITDDYVDVVASAAYAAAIELGARPHDITPNARKALRFAKAGSGPARLTGSPRVGQAVQFAKIVHHPGNRPYPFLRPAAKIALEQEGILEEVIIAWNKAD